MTPEHQSSGEESDNVQPEASLVRSEVIELRKEVRDLKKQFEECIDKQVLQVELDKVFETMSSMDKKVKSIMTFKDEVEKAGFLRGTILAAKDDLLTAPEFQLRAVFPIYKYTEGTEKLLQADIVGQFIRNEMKKSLYTAGTTTRPAAHTVLADFIEFTLSKRFQVQIEFFAIEGKMYPQLLYLSITHTYSIF